MEITLGLVTALPVAFALLLAILRSGIRRQERALSLASQPRGLSAALARRVLGLHVSEPADFADEVPASRSGQTIANEKKACCR